LLAKSGSFALEEAKAETNKSKEYGTEIPSRNDDELMAIISKELKRSPLKAAAA